MEKKIVQVQERTQQLIRQLLNVWESSVRATHDFLSEEEIIKIREYVPMAIENVEYLIIAEKEFGEPVAFMGIDSNRLEMLFLSPEVRGIMPLARQMSQCAVSVSMDFKRINCSSVRECSSSSVQVYSVSWLRPGTIIRTGAPEFTVRTVREGPPFLVKEDSSDVSANTAPAKVSAEISARGVSTRVTFGLMDRRASFASRSCSSVMFSVKFR